MQNKSTNFKTTKEQCQDLINKGMQIVNIESAGKFLLYNNYYKVIREYANFFIVKGTNDAYKKGTSFEEVVYLYEFDQDLRNTLFQAVMQLEKHFSSVIAQIFPESISSKNISNEKAFYLTLDNYVPTKSNRLKNTLDDIEKIIEAKSKQKSNPIKYYVKNSKEIPFGILITFLDYGQITTLLSFMHDDIKNEIARNLSFFLMQNTEQNVRFDPQHMVEILEHIRIVRNKIAHNEKLLNHTLSADVPYIKNLHELYAITKNSYRRKMYDVLISFQCFLSKEQINEIYNTLRELIKKLEKKMTTIQVDVVLKSLGFPTNWHK